MSALADALKPLLACMANLPTIVLSAFFGCCLHLAFRWMVLACLIAGPAAFAFKELQHGDFLSWDHYVPAAIAALLIGLSARALMSTVRGQV